MPTPSAIISSGGPFHAYHMARGAAAAGYLNRFLIGYFDPREEGIDRRLVTQILPAEIVGQLLWRLPGAGTLYYSYALHNDLYDHLSRPFISPPANIFHVFNHFGLHAMRKAKHLGMHTIVERSGAHPVSAHRILTEEYARFGLRFPAASRLVENKAVKEFAEADTVMVCSDFVARTLIEEGVDPAKLRHVQLGFSPERFQPDPTVKSDDTFRVIFVGTLSLQKGVQYLLEAFKKLNLPNAELVLVGGDFKDSQSFLPKYHGTFTRVSFVPHSELPRLYNNASVFVLPSLQDGFGMVVYEAAACGLPVIITENVGAHIREGQDGYIVPIRDSAALADRLLHLHQNPDLRRQMGQSAHAYVQQFTWQAYHAQLAAHYRALISDHP